MRYYYYVCLVCCFVLNNSIIQCSPHSAFLTGSHSRQRTRPNPKHALPRKSRLQQLEKVLVPPDYKYRAYGKVNITVIDSGGLPWYCYTGEHVRCIPLFRLPGKWRTTRFPHIYTPTTPPNPNKARSTIPTTTTTMTTTTIMEPHEEETTPMTTASRFRSTPLQTVTQIPRLNRELNYSKPIFQEDSIESNLQNDKAEARSISVPQGFTFSKLIKVTTKNSEANSGKSGWKPVKDVSISPQVPRFPSSPLPRNDRFSSQVKFKKTINVVDKGGEHLNFTTQKSNDSSNQGTSKNGNTYTQVNIHHLNWIPIQNSEQDPNDDFQNKIDRKTNFLGPQGDNGYRQSDYIDGEDSSDDSINIDWPMKTFPNFPANGNLILTTTFNDSDTSELQNNRREGSVAESINKFIYSKFVKPNQLNYSQEDLERFNILSSNSTNNSNSTQKVFNVRFPWDKPSRSFIPVSTVTYELPQSTSPESVNFNEDLRLPIDQKVSKHFNRQQDGLESTTINNIETTKRNGSRAIGEEVITQRSFDKSDDNVLQRQHTISNSPRFVPIKPEDGAVTVKLGINLKVDSRPRSRIKEVEIDEAPGVEIAQAYTVFGELCRDSCSNRGFSYTWCHKKVSSDVGAWTDSDYCTSTPNITHYGDHCIDICEERGEKYYWCHKDSSLWGYCTPRKLYKKTLSWRPAKNEIEPKLPIDIPLAFTVRGEACKDECNLREGYSYKWCAKMKPSNLGSWTDNDYCTIDATTTANGERCSSKCGFEGYSYAWCYTQSSWGYCTPESFLDFLQKLHPPGNPFGLNRLTTSTLYPFIIETTSQTPRITTTPKRDVRTLELESFADFLREDKEVKNVNQEINEAIFMNVDKYPKNYRKAKGFTSWGESCYDDCEKRGYDYTWCHKFESSSNGDWSHSGLCSTKSNITAFGENCLDECEKRGFSYFWCHKDTSLWGYCTPDKLLNHLANK